MGFGARTTKCYFIGGLLTYGFSFRGLLSILFGGRYSFSLSLASGEA